MEWIDIEGKDHGSIRLYALSTCNHCRNTRRLLSELGVAFSYLEVDLLPEDELKQLLEEVLKWNPRGSFPTLVIDDRIVVVGYREEQIREALG